MNTISLPVSFDNDKDRDLMLKYISQQTHLFRAMFKHLNMGEKVDANTFNHYKDIDLLDFHLKQSALYDAKAIVDKQNLNKIVCFGGRKNFFRRQFDKIDKETYQQNRLHPFCVIGEKKSGTKSVYSNRRFKLKPDLSGLSFRATNRNINMNFPKNIKKNYKDILMKLYNHQVNGDIPLTYRLSADSVLSISYDESLVFDIPDRTFISDLIFAIDMNPNYIGWSVVRWTTANQFVVESAGVIILKELNDYENKLIKEHYKSDSIERHTVNNQRENNLYHISKLLVERAVEYNCEYFAVEDLNIKSKSLEKGKYLNRLCIQQWNRNDFVNSLTKRCNLSNISLMKVTANYSSFWGNILFRELNMPDMVLASVEIGRRCFEFSHQYIKKDFKQRKNIVYPDFEDFKIRFENALNELKINKDCTLNTYKEVYKYIKDNKIKYRVDINKFKDYKTNDLMSCNFIKEIKFR